MQIKINYGVGAGVFPTSCAEQVKRASLCDLKVLWLICAKGGAAEIDELCAFAGASESEVISSLSYWRGAGVIEAELPKSTGKGQKKPEPQKGTPKKLSRTDEPPLYTSEEIADVLEKNTDMASFIDECQRIIGKMFNIHEVKVLVELVDFLGLDFEYIMLVLTHCVSKGKTSMPYVRTTAYQLYNDGITSAEELSEELQRRERAASVEGRIRKLFGIGTRSLIADEKKAISAWVNHMNYPMEMVEKAYECAVEATGTATIKYVNRILERWFDESIRTIADVERDSRAHELAMSVPKRQKKGAGKTEPPSQNSSFDTDEFFEAAIRRSLGDALKEQAEATNSNIDTDKLFDDLVHHKIGGEEK